MAVDDELPTPPKRRKGVYIGAPACFLLEREGQHLRKAFCDPDGPYDGLYVVGSALERAGWAASGKGGGAGALLLAPPTLL